MKIRFNNGFYDGDGRGENIPNGYGCKEERHGGVTYEYEGLFLDNESHGYGKLTENGKDFYVGEWMKNKFHGYGCLKRNDLTYVGHFVRGVVNGFGVAFYPDGDIYVGEWLDGEWHGKGTLIECSNDETVNEGWWKNGKQHGVGFITNKKDEIMRCIFEDGKLKTGSSVRLSSRQDARLNDISGKYGRFTKNGKLYYGKYLEYDEDEYELVMSGMSVQYTDMYNWSIGVYGGDGIHGEFAECSDDGFERGLTLNGSETYFDLWYSDYNMSVQIGNGKQDVFRIDYIYGNSIYFGNWLNGLEGDRSVCYSLENESVSMAICRSESEAEKNYDYERLGENRDILSFGSTVNYSRVGDIGIDSSREKFSVGKVVMGNVKTLSPKKLFHIDREKGEIRCSSPDGSVEYVSLKTGERIYRVSGEGEIEYKVCENGDVSIRLVNENVTFIEKTADEFSRSEYTAKELINGTAAEWRMEEKLGGICCYVDKNHDADSFACENFVFSGGTKDGYPFGHGQHIFPGYGYVYGNWSGKYDCENAQYTADNGDTWNVTVKRGEIIFENGTRFRFISVPENE